MEPNTGYIITHQNLGMLSMISGKEQKTLKANIGWACIYQEDPYPRWSLVPKNAAEYIPGFKWVDSPLSGLPARSVKEIRKEWAEVNSTYAQKLEELQKELERAKMIAGDEDGSESNL